MPAPLDLPAALLAELESQGVGFVRYSLAFARVLPSVLIIPVFGLSPLAFPVRVTLGLALAFSVAPALSPVVADAGLLAYVGEFARGLPVALSASAVLWASSMTGALADELRGLDSLPRSVANESSTPLGTLLSLLVAIGFLSAGGPERLVRALSRDPLPFSLEGAAHDLVSGLELAVAVAAPLVVVSVVVEVAVALVSRTSLPVQLQSVLAPLRPLLVLSVFALLFDRMTELLVLALR